MFSYDHYTHVQSETTVHDHSEISDNTNGQETCSG